jgi:hypothetical protein
VSFTDPADDPFDPMYTDKPVAATCESDGYWDDERSGEHYWHCEEPAVDGTHCAKHLAEIEAEVADFEVRHPSVEELAWEARTRRTNI